jgi:aminoglycoside phosphotransferase (APT) family kinase protein
MVSNWIDRPAPVRQGEQIDAEGLGVYLQRHLPDLSGSPVMSQFPSGFSNLTYLVRCGEQEFVLRRPPLGVEIKSAHDMGREYRILTHLYRHYPRVPRPILHCTDQTVLGAPFYLMERVEGVILRSRMPTAMVPPPALMGRIGDAFIDNLAELHAVDYEAAGLGDLGRPAGYIQRQIGGWTKRYHQARTDDVSEIERVAAWLAEQMPAESDATLIHNDYKYDNLVLDPNNWSQIRAVLDWEMATLGDPLMDLGSTLGYWIEVNDPEMMHEVQFSPTTLPGNPSRAELVERYARQSGRDIIHIVFYYVYGVFKLAVVIQQLYRRYKLGLTQDPRYANLDAVVYACGQIGVQAIEKGRIDDLFT